MENNINVVFFDLFFTLITPKYNSLKNENDVLKLTIDEWEKFAEDEELYFERAIGNELNPKKIIESIIRKMNIDIDDSDTNEILKLREERLKRALIDVDSTVLDVLSHIKNSGKKICLISNADIIDVMHWSNSPLSKFFDDKIFSYEVGYLKPQSEIYKLALKKMNVTPKECIFIGDGGSDELKGAKELGMKTILTSYLLKRQENQLSSLKNFADYHIEDFSELKNIL